MSELNPYAKFLEGRPPLDVIRETPARLTALVEKLGDAGLARSYAPGKWSAAQIICHLADCEIGFGFRFRQCIAMEHYTAQPFDQEKWAWPYGALDARAALRAFNALREWNYLFIAEVPDRDRSRPFTHPERGTMTFWTVVETMAGHDRNHVRQVEQVAAMGRE